MDEAGGIDPFVDKLFRFNVLFFSNDLPDMRVIELVYPEEIMGVIADHFPPGSNQTQLMLKNGRNDYLCPYFKMLAVNYSERSVTNYKLQTFMQRTGILGVHSKCDQAIIIGFSRGDESGSPMDIPIQYRWIPVDMIEPVSVETLLENRPQTHERLMSIPGLSLPCFVPDDIHWNIMKYLRHPCAQLIKDHRDRLLSWLAYWDDHFRIVLAAAW